MIERIYPCRNNASFRFTDESRSLSLPNVVAYRAYHYYVREYRCGRGGKGGIRARVSKEISLIDPN